MRFKPKGKKRNANEIADGVKRGIGNMILIKETEDR